MGKTTNISRLFDDSHCFLIITLKTAFIYAVDSFNMNAQYVKMFAMQIWCPLFRSSEIKERSEAVGCLSQIPEISAHSKNERDRKTGESPADHDHLTCLPLPLLKGLSLRRWKGLNQHLKVVHWPSHSSQGPPSPASARNTCCRILVKNVLHFFMLWNICLIRQKCVTTFCVAFV